MLHKMSLNSHKLGMLVSLVCAIHCLAVPISMMVLGNHSHSTGNHWVFDLFILLTATAVMAYSIFSLKIRVSTKVIVSIALGAILFLSSWFLKEPFNHIFFVLGSISWLYAHMLNYRNAKAQNA